MAKKIAENSYLPILATLALAGLIFTAPSNLFFKFDQLIWAVRGLRIDYLLPKIYLSDLLAAGTLVIFKIWQEKFSGNIQRKKVNWSWLGIFSLLIGCGFLIRQFFTPFPGAALAGILRLWLIWSVWFSVKPWWQKLHQNWLWWTLILTNIFQAFIGICQFFNQQSVGTYTRLLGEANLNSFAGIASGSFGSWGLKILPYGTTAHPNILAGWLVGSWLLAFYWSQKLDFNRSWQAKIGWWLSGFFTLEIIVLAQSWSAGGFLIFGLAWFFGLKNKFQTLKINWWQFSLILTSLILSPWWLNLITNQLKLTSFSNQSLSWSRREMLLTAAEEITQKNWLWGSGLNQFTAYLETMSHQQELVRFVQPVHHVGWLWLSETGLMGVAIFWLLIFKLQKNQPKFFTQLTTWMIIMAPVFIWDHYLLTSPTGLWLSWWWLMFLMQDAGFWKSENYSTPKIYFKP